MDISDNFKKMLVKEINFVVKKMDESSDGFSKLYYFSGIYALLHRIMNLEFNPDLIVAHLVLNTTYKEFRIIKRINPHFFPMKFVNNKTNINKF